MKNVGTIFAAWLVLAAAALAQMEMPKPGPEHKKLDMFAGAWMLEGDMKPGPMGPGGKMTEYERCEWMDGGFFLICHTDFKSGMGNGSGMSIMGYSNDDKSYTYREFNSWGEFDDSKGSLNGDTWTWTSDEKMGGADDQRALHDESHFADVLRLHFRNVAGWNEVVNLHGWQSHEVKVILHSVSPQGFSRAAEAFLSGAR